MGHRFYVTDSWAETSQSIAGISVVMATIDFDNIVGFFHSYTLSIGSADL